MGVFFIPDLLLLFPVDVAWMLLMRKKQFRTVPQELYKFDLFYRSPFELNAVSSPLFCR